MERTLADKHLTIRKASADDLNAIGRLWQELMAFLEKNDSAFAISQNGPEGYKHFLAENLSVNDFCILVAEQDSEIVGYCFAKLIENPILANQHLGMIYDLAVTERFRRTGLGTKLYSWAQDWFAANDVHRIEIRVSVHNETSKAFWKKMGFEPFLETSFKKI